MAKDSAEQQEKPHGEKHLALGNAREPEADQKRSLRSSNKYEAWAQ